MKRLAAALVLMLILASCKDDSDIKTDPQRKLCDSYQPVTKGSVWNYNLVYLTSTVKETVAITGNSTTISGHTYFETATESEGKTTISYFGNEGSRYTKRSSAVDVQDILEEPYLDEGLAAGSSFTSKGNDTGISHGRNVQFVITIKERDYAFAVNNITYKNVIHTHVELQYSDAASYFKTTETHEYFIAKGIGVVEEDIYVDGTLFARHLLTSYNLL